MMALQESGEMYLETILTLTKRGGLVRAIDVGEEMGYSKPSVSRAMGLLKQGGFIVVDKDGGISLTEGNGIDLDIAGGQFLGQCFCKGVDTALGCGIGYFHGSSHITPYGRNVNDSSCFLL